MTAVVEHGGNGYAALAHARVQADLMYLSRYRIVGAAAAGAEVCERYGHDQRGRVCQRCGQPTL